jgi:GAF domain-containing protein
VTDQLRDDLLDSDLLSVVDQAARALRADVRTPEDLVAAVAAETVRIVPGADEAGIIVVEGAGQMQVVATTSPIVDRVDDLQRRLDDGPCLQTARGQAPVHVPDVANDPRWPEFAAVVTAEGIAAMLCLPLQVDRRRMGTLTAYSRTAHAFDEGAEAIARVLATLAALSLAEAGRTANLRRALENRDLIGQAKGVLMASRRITADAAFAILAKHSQDTNQKLALVAAHVAETGALPGV